MICNVSLPSLVPDPNLSKPALSLRLLLQRCRLVLTDSGGLQKEAFFFGKACVTMRDQTEWVELVEVKANTLVGAVSVEIIEAVSRNLGRRVSDLKSLYGGGQASQNIALQLSIL